MDAHVPVLAGEAFEALAVRADGLYIDATFGRGGHTALILGALGPEGRVLAFDRDPAAIAAGHRRFPDEVRLALVGAPFADIAARVPQLSQGRPVRGILFDLGVSSPQLDDPTRGFSFRADGPLDMRMDPASGEPVSAWLARAGEPEIREVIATLGEERFARRSWPSSSLTCMRSAWNVRVAGCLPGSRVRTVRATISASCSVRVIGCRARSATARSAIATSHAWADCAGPSAMVKTRRTRCGGTRASETMPTTP